MVVLFIWNTVIVLPFTSFLEAIEMLNQERENHTYYLVTLKLSTGKKCFSSVFQTIYLVLRSLVLTWNTSLEAMSAMILE